MASDLEKQCVISESSLQVQELNAENKFAHLGLLLDLQVGVTKVDNRPTGYFIGFVVSQQGESLFKAVYQDDHRDQRLGSDYIYIQIRRPHRASVGVSLFHDSKISPTSKYQAAAVGSRRKELYTRTYMHGTCAHSCTVSMIHQH